MVNSGSGNAESMHFRSFGESTDDDDTAPGGHQMNSVEENGETNGEHNVGTENVIEEVPR
jgi:hypothetical protein